MRHITAAADRHRGAPTRRICGYRHRPWATSRDVGSPRVLSIPISLINRIGETRRGSGPSSRRRWIGNSIYRAGTMGKCRAIAARAAPSPRGPRRRFEIVCPVCGVQVDISALSRSRSTHMAPARRVTASAFVAR
jgi:hypothetical protein